MTTLQFLLEPGEGLRSLRARGFPGTGVLLQRWPWKDNAREQQGVTSRIPRPEEDLLGRGEGCLVRVRLS